MSETPVALSIGTMWQGFYHEGWDLQERRVYACNLPSKLKLVIPGHRRLHEYHNKTVNCIVSRHYDAAGNLTSVRAFLDDQYPCRHAGESLVEWAATFLTKEE